MNYIIWTDMFQRSAYHDTVSEALDADGSDGSASELKRTKMAGEHYGDEAEHVVQHRDDNRGSRELP